MAALRTARDHNDCVSAEAVAGFLLDRQPAEQLALHAAGHTLLTLGSNEQAVRCLEAAAAGEPVADIWNDLGVAYRRLGRLEPAVHAYQAALEATPDNPAALANLASTLYLVGRYEEAYAFAVRAAELAPVASDVGTTLAMIEGALTGFEAALVRLNAVLAAAPDAAVALAAKTYVLRRLERGPEALATATLLVARAPDGPAEELLGTCLRDLGRYPEALAAFDRAIAASANPAPALAKKADAFIDLGDADEARDLLDHALAVDPACIAAWAAVTQLRSFAGGDPELDTMEALLESPRVVLREERVLLHFALGRAHLAAGNDARAFEHYANGNRLYRRMIVYDVADDECAAAAIIARVDAGVLARLNGSTVAAEPIFVVGMPRSGTSFVEAILASLPGVHGAGELFAARSIIEGAGPYPDSVPALKPADVAQFGERYATTVAALAPGAARIVDKMPANYRYAGLLHVMLPKARIILCSRDTLDTTLSLYTQLFSGRQDFAYDLREIARYHRAYERVVAHWRMLLPAHAFFEVRYEDIVRDFEPTVRRLLEFCALPWAEACRQFHKTPRVVATASRKEVRAPLYDSSIGRGRRYAAYLEPSV